MSSKSWLFNQKKELGAMCKWSRPLRTSVTMCSLHPVWRNVYVKRLATWTIGPVAAFLEEGASGQALRERYLEPSLTTQSQHKARLELQARGAPVPPIKGVPILLSAGETKDEEDNEFIRWVHRTRRLSSMYALRASVSVADVRLERKLRYDYAKLKARGQLNNRTRYASATTVAASAGQTVTNNPLIDTTSGGKRPRSGDDTGHDVQKHPRRMNSLAEGESHTPMSSPTPGTLATLPDTGISHDDDVVSGVSPHRTGGSLVHRAASVEVGVPKEEHEKVLLELSGLRETLGKTQSVLDATQARVQVLESGHTWMEAQLDLPLWIQQAMAMPTSAAQAPPSSRGTDPDTA
uniref:Uncharacterized protein n=1 Tax=Hyaloperonospora arabidopsidis (strain Emoy2) TaxID=559515 RepID=M4C2A6_HYAAE